MAAIGLGVIYILLGSATVLISGIIASWVKNSWKGYGFVFGAIIMAVFMLLRMVHETGHMLPR